MSSQIPSATRIWRIANPPNEEVSSNIWQLVDAQPIPALKQGQILVKVTHFSNDPAQRGWIQADADPGRLYVQPAIKGDPMPSHGLATVVDSKSPKFSHGDKVIGRMYWAEFCVLDDSGRIAKVRQLPDHCSPTLPMSVFGGTWMAAYFGLLRVGQVQEGSSVLISGAAGATGGAAVQLCRHIFRCKRIIGIAGGPDKCKHTVDTLGADQCLDYKSPTFSEELAAIEEVDLYFDNVGGKVLDAALLKVKRFGRITLCGSISSYNDRSQNCFPNWFEVIANRITLQGFIASDYKDEFSQAQDNIVDAITSGKIATEAIETVVPAAFEDIPWVWLRLFKGENRGKLMTQLVASY